MVAQGIGVGNSRAAPICRARQSRRLAWVTDAKIDAPPAGAIRPTQCSNWCRASSQPRICHGVSGAPRIDGATTRREFEKAEIADGAHGVLLEDRPGPAIEQRRQAAARERAQPRFARRRLTLYRCRRKADARCDLRPAHGNAAGRCWHAVHADDWERAEGGGQAN